MYTPNPILLAATPAGGFTLPVTQERGGLAGYILLGQLGPPVTVELSADGGVNWQAAAYPHTLTAGETLRLTRTDAGTVLTTLRALAPVTEEPVPEPSAPPFTTTTDSDGYQTISNTDTTTDGEGYQTIPDATATADPDGYESVERS